MKKFIAALLMALILSGLHFACHRFGNAFPVAVITKTVQVENTIHRNIFSTPTFNSIWGSVGLVNWAGSPAGRSVCLGVLYFLALFLLLNIIFGIVPFFRDLSIFFPLRNKG